MWLMLWCMMAVVTAGAQQDSSKTLLTGRLVLSTGEPLGYATVTLLKTDSSVAGGDLSKDNGSFSLATPAPGRYILRIESIGVSTLYRTFTTTADTPGRNFGTIIISPAKTTLKSVDIVAEKPVVELKVDKKVFNVEKNTTTAGGTATDVLQNIPSVSVDADGNVSLRGKSGVTILIDGKPATMLGSDVNSALQSLPASSIENVEVIANPSAKYDAQGNTGIINITTKKDKRLGVNGSVTLGAGTRDKYNGNLSLNVHKGKWNAFLNSSVRLNSTFNNVTTTRVDKMADSSYYTYEHAPRHFNGSFNTVGVTYDADKYNSLTLTENINIMRFGFTDYSDYDIYSNHDYAGSPVYHQYRYSKGGGGPFSVSSALDYKHKFKKKDEEINIDATYTGTAIHRKQDYETRSEAAGGTPAYYPIYQSAPGSGTNNSFAGWADYTNPLTTNGKLGLGVKTQLFWFSSSNDPRVDSTGRPSAVDTSVRAIYSYTQQIHAAYVNWNDQVGKFSYQLGLRLEDARYQGDYTSRSSAGLSNNFTNLFPSAFFSYQFNSQQNAYLNYSRRTNRPSFFQLLPYLDLSNPSTVNTGNPSLLPEFIDNIEFSYNRLDKKGNNIILSAYYQYTHNLIERITRPATGEFSGRLLVMPENIASGSTYGLEGIANLKFTRIWDATLNANVFYNQLIIGNSQSNFAQYLSNNNGLGWFAKANTNIKLPANFALQLNGNYESQKVTAQGTTLESYWVDVALRKNLLKNKKH